MLTYIQGDVVAGWLACLPTFRELWWQHGWHACLHSGRRDGRVVGMLAYIHGDVARWLACLPTLRETWLACLSTFREMWH